MLGVGVHALSFISSTPLLLRRASFKHSGLMTFKMSTVQKSTIDCPLNTGRGCCNEDSQNFTIESFQSDQGKLNVKKSASMRVKECQVMSKFEEAGNSKREVQIKKDLDIKCYDGFEKLTVTKLREMLRKQGIQPSGRKQDLIQTLRNLFVENNAGHIMFENLHKQNEFNENGKNNMGYDITSSSNLPGKESSGNGTSQSQQKVDELDCCLDKSTGSKRRKLSKNIECESPSSTYYSKEDILQHEAVRPCSLLVHKKPQPEWVAYNPDLMRSKQFSSENTVKVISWNVNGFRALLKKKENFFSQLVERENFDVICLQETKLQEKDVEAIKGNLLDGYDHSFWTCSASKLGYAGTAVISRIKPISVTFGLGIPDHDSEGRLITVEFESVFLVAGYIPNSGQNLERLTYRVQRWDPCLSSYIKDLEKKKPVVLTGDLNCAYEEIDIYNPDGNHRSAGFTDEERKSFEESFLKRGFVDSFRRKHPNTVAYTYWGYRQNARQGNRGWRLDYFLVSESIAESVYDSYTIPDINGSDHCPIGLVLKFPVL